MTDEKRVSAFNVARTAAGQITCPNPEQEQPEEYRVLKAAMELLTAEDEASANPEDKYGQKKLCRSLSQACLLDTLTTSRRASTFGLYAVAHLARMSGIASGTVAIRNAIVIKTENPLTFTKVLGIQDLMSCGLLDYNTVQTRNGKNISFEVFRLGHEALEKAERWLRDNGKVPSANVLSEHIAKGEQNRARIAATKRAVAARAVATADEETKTS